MACKEQQDPRVDWLWRIVRAGIVFALTLSLTLLSVGLYIDYFYPPPLGYRSDAYAWEPGLAMIGLWGLGLLISGLLALVSLLLRDNWPFSGDGRVRRRRRS
jgi:hypothetical protein